MANITGCSRSAILIKDNIKYKRREDLEDDITSNVWIEIETDKQPILIMSGYRQWHLPKKYGFLNSGTTENRKNRFLCTLNKWEIALKEKKDLIVMMDTNIDTSNGLHNQKYKVSGLLDILQEFLNANKISIMNSEMTFFKSQKPTSCIDHIYSNCSEKMDIIKTNRHPKSDHAILSTKYNSCSQIKIQNICF